MCVAVIGEVLSISGKTARVSVRGNMIDVDVSLVSATTGSRVLVHAGCALQVMPQQEADDMDALFDELMRAAHETP